MNDQQWWRGRGRVGVGGVVEERGRVGGVGEW